MLFFSETSAHGPQSSSRRKKFEVKYFGVHFLCINLCLFVVELDSDLFQVLPHHVHAAIDHSFYCLMPFFIRSLVLQSRVGALICYFSKRIESELRLFVSVLLHETLLQFEFLYLAIHYIFEFEQVSINI